MSKLNDFGILPLDETNEDTITSRMYFSGSDYPSISIEKRTFDDDIEAGTYSQNETKEFMKVLCQRLGQYMRIKDGNDVVLRFGSDDNIKYFSRPQDVTSERFHEDFEEIGEGEMISLPLYLQKGGSFIPLNEIVENNSISFQSLLLELDITNDDITNAITLCMKTPFIEGRPRAKDISDDVNKKVKGLTAGGGTDGSSSNK